MHTDRSKLQKFQERFVAENHRKIRCAVLLDEASDVLFKDKLLREERAGADPEDEEEC